MARTVVVGALALSLAACGYDTSATFNADGSVVVGLKFLFPKSLMQGTSGTTVTGFSAADIANANANLQKKYPGGKVTVVTEGDETGAAITVPFKTEKEAFDFMTQPSTLNPSSAATSGASVNLSNTGGLFTSASHTSSGGTDTYTFQTAAARQPSPSPGTQQVLTGDEISSIFTITFALTVPHEITSAPGALFTLDRKTAIWKLDWTKAETLTATTGGTNAGLVANVSPAPSMGLTVAVGLIAIGLGFLVGMLLTWRGLRSRRLTVAAVAQAPLQAPIVAAPPPFAGPPPDVKWPGPPPGAPPPTEI